VCAARTGSFIEEQAMRLDVALDDIPALTLGKTAPFTSDRCTVYMERDLNTLLAEGWDKAATMAAVLFSVRDNYLSKVVGKTPFGKCVYFQGATARNQALVAAFAAELGTNVKVSRFCHLTGALGCALALREAGVSASDFAGTDITYSVDMEVCELCANKCDLSVYTVNGRKAAWGMKCGRDYNETERGKQKTFSDLEAAFRQIMRPEAEKEAGGPVVALPQVVYMSEYGPLFESFLLNLGFKVKMIGGSEKALAEGSRRIQADFCAPIAMVHGVVLNALQSDCDYVFFPTIINAPHESDPFIPPKPLSEKSEDRYFCYYSAYAPTILASAAPSGQRSRLISPKISFFRRSTEEVAERLAEDLKEVMQIDPDHAKVAFMDAWKDFETRRHIWRHLGEEKREASKDKIAIMLMARPYVLFDRGLNKGIPAKLESMGFDLMVQSMVHAPEDPDIRQMHWHYGQQMMAALDTVAENPHIYPVFISCFRCSPDAYLMTAFKARMEKMGKPYLILQLDEHGSDVGYQTRIEAAAETFATHFASKNAAATGREIIRRIKTELNKGDTLLIPYTDGRINRLQAAVFRYAGYDARVMTLTPEQIHLGYRYASGGECLPNVAILGSMIGFIRKESLDPENTMLYLPSICLACNFPQYGAMIMNGLAHAGILGTGILTFNGLESVPGLSMRENVALLAASNIGSLLHKLAFRLRPYETTKGATETALSEAETAVIDHIMAGKSMINAAKAVREIVEKLPLPDKRKPRIAVLGDLYAKYNDVLNERVWDLAESLGGEILVPSYNEMVIHGIYADALGKGTDTKSVATMVKFEQKFEAVFTGILDDQFEPAPEECHQLMQKYGMDQPIPGETAISIGRTLHYAEKGLVSAIIHVNPVFCCPGVVSSAIFKRLQEETGIPVIDLFYDGTNKPNSRIIPHLYYLTGEKRAV
jgi:predicted nucleotide-binding protein (sugar kinase/HSP70/actin superfamily)